MRVFLRHALIGGLATAVCLSACGGSAASSASRSGGGVVAAATASVPAVDPRPYTAGSLEPGWYRTSNLDPVVAFQIQEGGWAALFDEEPDGGVAMAMNGLNPFIGVARVPRVIEPDGTLGEAPEDLVAWLLAHPRLEARPLADRSSLAGLPVRAVEYAPTGADVALYYHPGGNFHVPPNVTVREYVMPLDGADLVVTVGLGPDPAATEGDAESILDSLQILD